MASPVFRAYSLYSSSSFQADYRTLVGKTAVLPCCIATGRTKGKCGDRNFANAYQNRRRQPSKMAPTGPEAAPMASACPAHPEPQLAHLHLELPAQAWSDRLLLLMTPRWDRGHVKHFSVVRKETGIPVGAFLLPDDLW